jgi:hypothetical protein
MTNQQFSSPAEEFRCRVAEPNKEAESVIVTRKALDRDDLALDGDGLTGETDNRPSEAYDRRRTAYHEAGHAVAAVMRGGKCCHITIEPEGDYDGRTNVVVAQHNLAFVTYAGIWAEARAEWGKVLDGEDDNCLTFDDHVAIAFERNAEGDLREYRRLMIALAAAYGDLNALLTYESEKAWGRQLEAKWLVIQKISELLIAEADVSTEVVLGLLA